MFTSQQLENYRSKRKVLLDQERLKSFLSTWNIKIQGWKKLTSLCCCNAVITVVCSAVLLKLFHHDKALHNCKPAVQPASGRLFHLMKTNQHQKQTSAFKAPPLHCKAGLWTLRSLFEKASSVRERKYIVAFFFFLVTLDVFTTPGGIVLVIKKVFLNLCQGVTSNISKVYASREKIFFFFFTPCFPEGSWWRLMCELIVEKWIPKGGETLTKKQVSCLDPYTKKDRVFFSSLTNSWSEKP